MMKYNERRGKNYNFYVRAEQQEVLEKLMKNPDFNLSFYIQSLIEKDNLKLLDKKFIKFEKLKCENIIEEYQEYLADLNQRENLVTSNEEKATGEKEEEIINDILIEIESKNNPEVYKKERTNKTKNAENYMENWEGFDIEVMIDCMIEYATLPRETRKPFGHYLIEKGWKKREIKKSVDKKELEGKGVIL